MSTEPAPEPLTAEDADWLPTVRMALNYGFPADIDVTRRLLDIIDRLDRTIRVATPSSVTPDLRAALAVDLGQTHDHEIGLHDRFESVFRAQAKALIARGWTLASVTPSEPTLDAPLSYRIASTVVEYGGTSGTFSADDRGVYFTEYLGNGEYGATQLVAPSRSRD